MNITCIDNKYNAYFHPVGSYSGGYGNVSVTKKLSYFPFLEEDITFIHAIHYDLSEDSEDGTKLDHKHILSELIWKQFVLNDQNENKNIKSLNLSEIKSIKIFNSRNSQSSTLSIKQSQEFVNQLNNSINIGMTKSLHEFEITINLISGETRKLSVKGNSIKDWKTNDITYKAKDLSFLKRFEEENSQKNPSKNILRTGNKELKSFEETYEQKWSTKPNIFPYSKYSKIRAFKIECSGECFKAEFRHRKAEGKEVSQKQFDNLMKILKNPDSYGRTTAACFDPGFALVLYDEKNIPSEFMSFCLDCNSFRTYPGEINVKYKNELLYRFSKEARNKLRSFFSNCGVDYQNKSSMFD